MSANPTSRAASPPAQQGDSLAGFLFAFGAYFIWGLFPFYFKWIEHIPAFEIVLHRSLWSLPVAGIALLLLRRTADLRVALRTPRTLGMAVLTSFFIAVNWGVYVWAVASDHIVQAALGYYINPLVNVVVGALLLGEKLTGAQKFAVGLAAVAVLVQTVSAGVVPWVALLVASTFCAYGFLRKTLPIGPSQGFFLEVLILSIPALAGILWLQARGEGHMSLDEPFDFALLLGCGIVTTIPLLLFGYGARLLRFATIGLMQYITPTLIFLIAVLVFGEPFGPLEATVFTLIWIALAIFTVSTIRSRR